MFHILAVLIELYIWLVMFPMALLSWFPVTPGSGFAKVRLTLTQLTEPVLRPVRRYIKPIGNVDLSFIIVFFVLEFIVVPLLLR